MMGRKKAERRKGKRGGEDGRRGIIPCTLRVWHELTARSDQGAGGAKTGEKTLLGNSW